LTSGSPPPARESFRAVLDTSVLLSEHRHWLWLLARLGSYRAVWSAFIIGELVRIRVEHSIGQGVSRAVYRQRLNDLIHLLSDELLIVNYREIATSGALSDPDDEPILATALAAGAECVVSLNTRDFPSGVEACGVRFLTPQVFLTELVLRHPGSDIAESADEAGHRLPLDWAGAG
jgi:predicted nucleic acid-binding protein